MSQATDVESFFSQDAGFAVSRSRQANMPGIAMPRT